MSLPKSIFQDKWAELLHPFTTGSASDTLPPPSSLASEGGPPLFALGSVKVDSSCRVCAHLIPLPGTHSFNPGLSKFYSPP